MFARARQPLTLFVLSACFGRTGSWVSPEPTTPRTYGLLAAAPKEERRREEGREGGKSGRREGGEGFAEGWNEMKTERGKDGVVKRGRCIAREGGKREL